ncbi:zinc finger MYM-type protein 2-like [Antedon mediterranea]|uniref:zinc finger MYM-type protein 2-like n=1 Tax=Antedon mediterranea TaxID=105859 RepID=UPI003AF7417A
MEVEESDDIIGQSVIENVEKESDQEEKEDVTEKMEVNENADVTHDPISCTEEVDMPEKMEVDENMEDLSKDAASPREKDFCISEPGKESLAPEKNEEFERDETDKDLENRKSGIESDEAVEQDQSGIESDEAVEQDQSGIESDEAVEQDQECDVHKNTDTKVSKETDILDTKATDEIPEPESAAIGQSRDAITPSDKTIPIKDDNRANNVKEQLVEEQLVEEPKENNSNVYEEMEKDDSTDEIVETDLDKKSDADEDDETNINSLIIKQEAISDNSKVSDNVGNDTDMSEKMDVSLSENKESCTIDASENKVNDEIGCESSDGHLKEDKCLVEETTKEVTAHEESADLVTRDQATELAKTTDQVGGGKSSSDKLSDVVIKKEKLDEYFEQQCSSSTLQTSGDAKAQNKLSSSSLQTSGDAKEQNQSSSSNLQTSGDAKEQNQSSSSNLQTSGDANEQNKSSSSKEIKVEAEETIKIKEEKVDEKTTNKGLIISKILSRLATFAPKSQMSKEKDKNNIENDESTSASVGRHGKGDHPEHVRKSVTARKISVSPIKKEIEVDDDVIVINDKSTSANLQINFCSNCCQVIANADVSKWTTNVSGQEKQFCSNACMNINPYKSLLCSLCKKDMKTVQDTKVCAPSGPSGRFLEFCSHACVMSYEERKNAGTHCYCTVCSSLIALTHYKHSLRLKGRLFRLCSTDCQKAFMKDNHVQPVKTCCECKTKFTFEGVMQEVKGVKQTYCSEKCKSNNVYTNCLMCKKINAITSLTEVHGKNGEKHLVCNGLCTSRLMHRLKTPNVSILSKCPEKNNKNSVTQAPTESIPVTANVSPSQQKSIMKSQNDKSGVYPTNPVNCNHCNTYQAPLYHLTMSDKSVRNFCSYKCVIGFQMQFNMPPVTLPQEELTLHCKYCKKNFKGKPITLNWKDDIHFFCSENCSATYKKTFCVIISCDNCLEERIHHSTIYFSGKERNFCSEGCHLLFKQSFTQKLGLRWCICEYCSQIGPTAIEKRSEGHAIKLCSKKCREKYDQWQKQVTKCEGCKQQGRLLNETFMWRGEAKKVCNQLCLLLFYTQQNIPNMLTEVQQNIPNTSMEHIIPNGKQPAKVNSGLPVISNVFSIASNQNTAVRTKPAVVMVTKQTQITTTPVQPKPPTLPTLPAPKHVRNKMTMCKPIQQTKSTYCKPLSMSKETNTDGDWRPKLVVVPIPVPIYIPVPMQMYTTPVPHPVGIPTPVPVPMFLPVSTNNADKLLAAINEIKKRTPSDPLEAELLAMADAIAGEDVAVIPDVEEPSLFEISEVEIPDEVENSSDVDELPPALEQLLDEGEIQKLEEDILALSVKANDPFSFLEKPVITESVDESNAEEYCQRSTRSGRLPKKKRKRTNQRSSTQNKRARVENDSDEYDPKTDEVEKVDDKIDRHYSIGIGAYKLWVATKNVELQLKKQPGAKPFSFKPDILTNTSDELSYTLCHFVKEARKPDGEEYPPALLFYILLAIQHFLFNSSHPDNILTDLPFKRFMEYLVEKMKTWEPVFKPDTNIVINSKITEDLMWDCKQLGAHSPYVLLNTLVYFNTKFFCLKTLQDHKDLLFGMIFKDWKKSGSKSKFVCLRYFPSQLRKKLEETTCKVTKRSLLEKHYLEQAENLEDPLHCPVKLYEFYLSKCPETVKNKQNSLYLIPERMCIPDSPVWYSSCMLDDGTLEKMLAKALMVKDVHEFWAKKEQAVEEDDDYSPDEDS